ncbi:MAG: DNA polymerase IV [Steroidobacteraceae bacterium]
MHASRAILHVDMDAFYASVEERDDPSLAGRPLIVGGTGARGVVAAANYAVRSFGVRSAMPMRQALTLCPHAVCVAPRMSRYQDVSRQIFGVFHEFTPLVEGLSLDEAYLDVTASQALKGDAVSIARAVKARIHAVTGLTASIGVAPNKLVAKIASDLEKPDGLVVVETERINAVLDPLPVRRLPGLGRKAGERVERAGFATLGELRRAPDAQLWRLFGRYCGRVRERASGIDKRPVVADREDQSISAEDTFATDIADPARLQAELARLADRACARLRAKSLVASCVTVKIRQHDFATCTRQRRFAPAGNDSRAITALAAALLAEWLSGQPLARLRLLGVGVSELAPAEQLGLFDDTAAPQASRLDAALDRIREKFGARALTRASGLRNQRP